jgi:hypothetical protein
MTTIPECLIKPDVAGALRALVHALHLDIPKGDFGFLCPACRKPVKPFRDHFEHLKENPTCPLIQTKPAATPVKGIGFADLEE